MKRPKVGETWLTRENKIIKLIMFVSGKSHPNIGVDDKGVLHKYTRDGFYIGIDNKHSMDLIRKIENEQ